MMKNGLEEDEREMQSDEDWFLKGRMEMEWMACVEVIIRVLKSLWRCTPTYETEIRNEKDRLCEAERRGEWREWLEVSVMEREARVWNEVSRITGIDWNDCLLQRRNGGLMIRLDWREGRNGLRRWL